MTARPHVRLAWRRGPSTYLQTGATYLGSPVGSAQEFASNDYWNTSETFANDLKPTSSRGWLLATGGQSIEKVGKILVAAVGLEPTTYGL